MIFERGRNTNHDFILCDKTLENVQSFKYLGIHSLTTAHGFGRRKDLLNIQHLHYTIYLSYLTSLKFLIQIKKKGKRKVGECHNHKPQPFLDTKWKRKPTNPNKHKSNKRTKSTKISSLFPKRGNRNTKRIEKHDVRRLCDEAIRLFLFKAGI